jgi:hypothetical protein
MTIQKRAMPRSSNVNRALDVDRVARDDRLTCARRSVTTDNPPTATPRNSCRVQRT